MRHYETNSRPAATRLLALTVLADGGFDRNEVDALMEADLARRLGLGSAEFEHILREYCDDLLLSAHYLDSMRLKVADVVLVLYEKLSDPPFLLLDLNDIFVVFAAFLAVLIAIEIFVNITLYLRDDVIHVKLVIATALMAIARKVIVLDLSTLEPMYLFAIGVIVLALGLTYWLVSARPGD